MSNFDWTVQDPKILPTIVPRCGWPIRRYPLGMAAVARRRTRRTPPVLPVAAVAATAAGPATRVESRSPTLTIELDLASLRPAPHSLFHEVALYLLR